MVGLLFLTLFPLVLVHMVYCCSHKDDVVNCNMFPDRIQMLLLLISLAKVANRHCA